MDKNHRKALTQCRSNIVSDLSPDNEFWDKIAEQEIFTPLMLEYIQAKNPRPEKVRHLLDDLLRRGPDAFRKFLYCLDNSGHGHLADVIRQKEQLILNPNFCNNPILQEARFTGNIRGTSTGFQPTASNNPVDSHLPHSVSAQTINERIPMGQFPHSQSNPNIASSGTPVTFPSDESASSGTPVTSPSDASSRSTTSYPSSQLLSNTSLPGRNSSNNDISMENEHDGLTSQLPRTITQYDNRQQTSSSESTPVPGTISQYNNRQQNSSFKSTPVPGTISQYDIRQQTSSLESTPVPGTFSQYDIRQQTSSLESTPETISYQALQNCRAEILKKRSDEETKKQAEIEALQKQLQSLKDMASGKQDAKTNQSKPSNKPVAKKPVDENLLKADKNKKKNEPPKKSKIINKKPTADDDDTSVYNMDNICIFCGERNESFTEEGLDLHYWKHCPMLKRCTNCKQVVEIATYTDHLLNECEAKNNYSKCNRCTEAIPKSEYDQHVSEKSCNAAKSSSNHCPLCHQNVSSGEDGWKNHLMGKDGCKQNPRRLLSLNKNPSTGGTSKNKPKATGKNKKTPR